MQTTITAEFETIDMAERAAIAIRSRVQGIKKININTFFDARIRDSSFYNAETEQAFYNAQGSVGYSMYRPEFSNRGAGEFYEPAARSTATLTAVVEEESTKTAVRMIRGFGALNIKN